MMHIGRCVLVYYPFSKNNNNNNNWKYASLYTGETVSRRRGRSSSHKTIMFMLPRCSPMSIWQWSFCLCALPAAVRIYFYSLFSISRSSQFAESQNIIPTYNTPYLVLGRVFIKTKNHFTRVISKYFFDCKGETNAIRANNKKYSSTPMYSNIVGHIDGYKRSVELYSF